MNAGQYVRGTVGPQAHVSTWKLFCKGGGGGKWHGWTERQAARRLAIPPSKGSSGTQRRNHLHGKTR